jgi:hypothetical protein
MTLFRAALAAFVVCAVGASPVGAQTRGTAPAQGYVLHKENTVDRFVVEQWVSQANPEVSPAGFCDCITVVYEGDRLVQNLGPNAGIVSVSTIGDVTGDRRAELMVSNHSGGAHCCASAAIYSVDGVAPRPLLSLETGDCMGEIVDLDKDGIAEFLTCDASYGYAFCTFAFSPFPPAVFAYDRPKSEFVLATPRFARYLPLRSAADARKTIADYPKEQDIARCAALGPALDLIYTGRVAQGQRLFRQLYRGPDAADVERKAVAMARQSAMWTQR